MLARFHDLAQIQTRAVAKFELLAGLRAQNASEMFGLLARQLRLSAPHLVHKKPSPGHNVRMLDPSIIRHLELYVRSSAGHPFGKASEPGDRGSRRRRL